MEIISKFSILSYSSTFTIYTINEDLFKQLESPSLGYGESTSLDKKQINDRSILRFQDHEKVDENPNTTLPLIIISTINNHYVFFLLLLNF